MIVGYWNKQQSNNVNDNEKAEALPDSVTGEGGQFHGQSIKG